MDSYFTLGDICLCIFQRMPNVPVDNHNGFVSVTKAEPHTTLLCHVYVVCVCGWLDGLNLMQDKRYKTHESAFIYAGIQSVLCHIRAYNIASNCSLTTRLMRACVCHAINVQQHRSVLSVRCFGEVFFPPVLAHLICTQTRVFLAALRFA